MKLIAAALMIASLGVSAQPIAPICLPAKPTDVRVGVTYNADGSAAGAWAYWWCVSNGKVTYEWRAAPSTSFTPAVLASLLAYAMGSSQTMLPVTLGAADPKLAPMKVDMLKAVAADLGRPATPPPVTVAWVTPPFGAYTLYTAAGGKLTGIIASRKATANAPCDASVPAIKVGTSTFLPLKSGSTSEVTLCQLVK